MTMFKGSDIKSELKRKVITLDFETYFDKSYHLGNGGLSTSEYVRDSRFKVQCLGIREPGEEAFWVPTEEVEDVLKNYDWDECAVLCHHTHFDGLILSHHFGVVPAFYCDTLSMARVLISNHIRNDLDSVSRFYGRSGKKPNVLGRTKGIRDLPEELLNDLGDYCAVDVDETWNIFLKMINHMPDDELRLVDITVRAFCDPILEVNHALVDEVISDQQAEKRDIVLKSGVSESLLGSSARFQRELEARGCSCPLKWSEKQKKDIPALAQTDLEFQALRASPDGAVRALVEARLRVKSNIEEKRALKIKEHSLPPWKLPIYLNYGKAHTYRWTGGDKMNPQNLPRGSKLRRSLLAPEGQVLVVVDSSQIEARMNAWLAGQTDLLQVFKDYDEGIGEDPYALFATDIYGYPVNKEDQPTERFVGKTGILGLGYQMGAPKLRFTLAAGIQGPPVDVDMVTCQKTVALYRQQNYKIRNQWYTMQNMLGKMMAGEHYEYKVLEFDKERVRLPNGLYLYYPDLKAEWNDHYERWDNFTYKGPGKDKRVNLYGGKLTENIIQCLARLVVGEQMVHIADYFRVVTMTHDEVVYLAPEDEAQEAFEFGIRCLSTPVSWCADLPLAAEGGYDKCYSK